jgi:multidrug resistance protein, MATE family
MTSRRPSSGYSGASAKTILRTVMAPTDESSDSISWLPSFLQRNKATKTSPPDGAPTETSSLLPQAANHLSRETIQEDGETYDLEDEEKSEYQLVLAEFFILFRNSIPVILAYTLQNSLQTISVLVVGRLSPEDLATAAFSYMFAMATAWLIALGGTTALDTLGASVFTGSKNPHDLGILLQRAFVVLGVFYIPVAILWFFSEPVFKALGQDDQISRSSCEFLRCLIPGGLGYIFFECMKKYLQAQGEYITHTL